MIGSKKWAAFQITEEIASQEKPLKLERVPDFISETKRLAKRWLIDYCKNTTLHGFKYIVEKGNSVSEKIFWIVAILVMLFGSIWLIFEQLVYFIQSPTLISFQSRQSPISDFVFPAVTVCPGSQVHRSVFNLTWAAENIGSLNEDKKKMLDFSLIWCAKFYGNKSLWQHQVFDSNTVRRFATAVNGRERCEEFIPLLAWAGVNNMHNACDLCQPLMTRYGGCFSFNLQGIDQVVKHANMTAVTDTWATRFLGKTPIWSQDLGYLEKTIDRTPLEMRQTPWTARDGGFFNRMTLFLRTPHRGYDPKCKNPKEFIGFLHSPAELPTMSHSTFSVESGEFLSIQVNPKVYSINPGLVDWAPDKRGCYLSGERSLRYYSTYTHRNCQMECALNFSLTSCGCVPFNYPRYNDTPVCGSNQLNCYSTTGDKVDGESCGCLPSCYDIDFEIATSMIQRGNWTNMLADYTPDWSKYSYACVDVRYKMRFIQGLKREMHFGMTSLIANIGGLFSLFLGFTLLSFVEIIYFLTFKTWNYCKNSRMKNRSTTPETGVIHKFYYP